MCCGLAGSIFQTWDCAQAHTPMDVGLHASTLPCMQTAPTCAYVHTYVHRSSSTNHGRAGRQFRKSSPCSFFLWLEDETLHFMMGSVLSLPSRLVKGNVYSCGS